MNDVKYENCLSENNAKHYPKMYFNLASTQKRLVSKIKNKKTFHHYFKSENK